jgi:septal ring factor EnvC (AmiA/AmiB activator)
VVVQFYKGGMTMGDTDKGEYSQASEVERRLNNIDQVLKEFGTRISEVETRTVIYNEQIKMIFNILEDIKLSLKDVQKTVVSLEKRPADLSQKIFVGVLTSVITALLMLGLKFI